MMFRNSVRLLLTNFSNVWKLLVYYIICLGITVLLCLPIVSPVVSKLTEAGVFSDFVTFLNGIFSDPASLSINFEGVVNNFCSTISNFSGQFMVNYILFGFIVVIVAPFIFGLGSLAMGDVLYGFMTSQVRYTFTGSYIRNLGKSCLYCLVKMLTILPINLVGFGIVILMMKLFMLGGVGYILLNVLIFAAFLMLTALKVSLYNCWMPAMAVQNVGPFKALKINFRAVFRKFFRIYSNAIILMLCAVVINFCLGVFTLCIGFVISIPLTALAFIVFQMVAYFTSQGMRFYVYPDMFIAPKKFEEQDSLKKLRFLV